MTKFNYRDIKNMTREERDYLYEECNGILDQQKMDNEWNEVYDNYCMLEQVRRDEYYEQNIDAFEAFYEKHIKGNNDKWHFATKVWDEVYNKYGMDYIHDNNKMIARYCEDHPEVSVDYVNECFEAWMNFSTYSDWHKDMYGYRPHNM